MLKISDRGPGAGNLITGISRRVALDLGLIRKALTEVRLDVIEIH